MADYYTFPSSPTYNTEITKLKRSDPADAETVFNPLFQSLITNTHYVKLLAEQGNIAELELTIPTTGWGAGASEAPSLYYVDVKADDVTDTMIPVGGGIAATYQSTAKACGLNGMVTTFGGSVRFYAEQAPTADIAVSLYLLHGLAELSGGGTSGGGTGDSGGTSDYTLPAATRYVLGGIKVGDGLTISADGLLSVDTSSVVDDVAATDDDMTAMLDDVLGT